MADIPFTSDAHGASPPSPGTELSSPPSKTLADLWLAQSTAGTGTPSISAMAAQQYASTLNWAVIPQDPGTKAPLVLWKHYKDELRPPSLEEIASWYAQWPAAGVLLLLGPISGVIAVDIDSADAERELINRLGQLPSAPRSWRAQEGRSHLLFLDPGDVESSARITPWHPQLEFRGHGGYIVLPPSQHVSGSAYEWMRERSPFDLPLPPLPDAIREELIRHQASQASRRVDPARQPAIVTKHLPSRLNRLSAATQQFLSGALAHQPDWNNRLFAAACDLAGNGIAQQLAIEMLLKAAAPWNQTEHRNALRTIESAFSQQRQPARRHGAPLRNRHNSSRKSFTFRIHNER